MAPRPAETIDRSVAGEVLAPAPEVRAKLGRTAYRVLESLWWARSRDGYTHITIKGIATARGFERLSVRTVERALARLEAAGVVEALGWQRKVVEVRDECSRGERLVFMRRVRAEHVDREHIRIPRETAAWMRAQAAAPSWGGARAGAGRPAAPPASGIVSSGGMGNQDGVAPLDFKRRSDLMNRDQKQDPTESAERLSGSLRDPEVAAARPAARSFFDGLGGEHGAMLDGAQLAPRPLITPALPLDAVPPYPGASLLLPAILPSPPCLDPESTDLERAQILARAYRGAVDRRWGPNASWAIRRGQPIQRTKHYAVLLDAARELVAHEIAPAAWAAYSCDVWRRYGIEKKKAPPVRWVFSATRIRERRGWFRSEENEYAGGRAVFGDAHRKLIERYMRMRHDLARSSLPPSEVVARHFAPGEWDRLLDVARRENRDMQQRLRDAVMAGEWCW